MANPYGFDDVIERYIVENYNIFGKTKTENKKNNDINKTVTNKTVTKEQKMKEEKEDRELINELYELKRYDQEILSRINEIRDKIIVKTVENDEEIKEVEAEKKQLEEKIEKKRQQNRKAVGKFLKIQANVKPIVAPFVEDRLHELNINMSMYVKMLIYLDLEQKLISDAAEIRARMENFVQRLKE